MRVRLFEAFFFTSFSCLCEKGARWEAYNIHVVCEQIGEIRESAHQPNQKRNIAGQHKGQIESLILVQLFWFINTPRVEREKCLFSLHSYSISLSFLGVFFFIIFPSSPTMHHKIDPNIAHGISVAYCVCTRKRNQCTMHRCQLWHFVWFGRMLSYTMDSARSVHSLKIFQFYKMTPSYRECREAYRR